jgi:uncharacterized SAM-binding protein YcdF (DUF218 family)
VKKAYRTAVGRVRRRPTRAAPDPRLRRSVVSRPFAFVGELVQVGGPPNPARAGELIRSDRPLRARSEWRGGNGHGVHLVKEGVTLRLRRKKGLALYLLVFPALMLFLPSLLVAEDETDYADAIIVIGGDHKPARIQRAAELHRQGYAPIVIISAGMKVQEGNEWIPEAEVMYRQALALGLPEEALIIEDDSLSTIQNARYSKQICEDHNIESVLLVASAYHSGRARLVFREVMGAKISVSAQPAARGHHPLLWWLYPDQAYVVLYEYKNWIQYWLGLRY